MNTWTPKVICCHCLQPPEKHVGLEKACPDIDDFEAFCSLLPEPMITVYVFGIQRPHERDKEPWFTVFKNEDQAEHYPNRVTEVTAVLLYPRGDVNGDVPRRPGKESDSGTAGTGGRLQRVAQATVPPVDAAQPDLHHPSNPGKLPVPASEHVVRGSGELPNGGDGLHQGTKPEQGG
jgi:hypothetical protein